MAALVVAASAAPLFNATPAFAAGTLAGAATVKNSGGVSNLNSGTGATTFTLRLPSGASCPGDSAAGGYRVQSYMVPSSVDPSTLQFDFGGPTPQAVGASFRQPLFDTPGGNPYVDQQTANAATPGGPGQIINIPDFNHQQFTAGQIPAGVYNLGIACTLGPASATQMKDFWNTQITVTANPAGGNAQINWAVGTVPPAPTLSSPLGAGSGSLTATFTAGSPAPAQPVTGFTATATPTGGGTAITASGAGSPITITGLTNGTAYNVTVHATNPVGNSPESNQVSGTPAVPNCPAVTGLTATPDIGQVALSWTAPAAASGCTLASPAYQVTYTPTGGSPASPFTVNVTNATVTGLTAGTPYTFTVTPQMTGGRVATAANAGPATPLASTVIKQDITVVRPAGAIVLTQICGKNGAIAADPTATTGFPSGLPAVAAAGPGTMPTGENATSFSQYPYPTNPDGTPNPTYPTNCGINLGNSQFIRTGPGAGQFYAASGVMSQVTIADTRDTDTGWNITGTMGQFVKTTDSTKKFGGNQLGWKPYGAGDTPLFLDGDGNSYDQVTAAGASVLPNTQSGMASGKVLGSAATMACTGGPAPAPTTCTGGLGIASFDATLKLLIPVTAVSGTYTGTLSFTAS